MRDILLRQSMGNQTISVARLQQNIPSTPSPSSQTGTLPSGNIAGAGVGAQLEQARQQQESRRQKAGDKYRSRLGQSLGSVATSLFNSTPLAQPMPQSFGMDGESEPELMTKEEMQTAREQPSEKKTAILNSLKFRNPMASETQLTSALSMLENYQNMAPQQIATSFVNFSVLNIVYATLADNGFIPSEVWEEYQGLTTQISRERGGRKRTRLLGELANHYRDNIYDKFINEIANRPSGSSAT